MYSLSCVPCVQISSTNVSIWWNQLIQCINESHFVALDLELSGLGDRNKLNAKQAFLCFYCFSFESIHRKIDERYAGVVEAAKTRSVLSIGFAFFKFSDNNSNHSICDNSSQLRLNLKNITKTKAAEESCLSNPFEDINRFEALDSQLSEELETEPIVCAESETNGCEKEWNITANVFNMLCLCEDHYICEPETMRFLAGHGFDFNTQCLHGLSYHRGNDVSYYPLLPFLTY